MRRRASAASARNATAFGERAATVLVPSVPVVPPASVSAPAAPAAEQQADAAPSATDGEDTPVLSLVDPEPTRPLPKVPYFIEVRGDGVDAVATRGCGKQKSPSVVYATHNEPAMLIVCADGAGDADPDVTLGIPYLRGAGVAELGHSQFSFPGEGYESRVQLTVRITKFGSVGKAVEGSYITAVGSADGSVSKTFFGRFRLLHLPDDPSVIF